ncbi:MAG: dockerin type I domain-containing protein [Planctomycetota bacterium]
MLPDGAFGPDLSTNGFTFTVETIDVGGYLRPRVLKIQENATSLTHRTWVAIRNVETPKRRNVETAEGGCRAAHPQDRLESRSHSSRRADALGGVAHPQDRLESRSHIAGWAGVAPFEVQYVVLMGDVDNDGFVKSADASAVYPHVSFLPVPDDSRYDVNGDGYVQNADASAIYPRVSFLPKPAKPSGH